MVADVFQEKPQRNMVPRIARLTRGGDQINYLCKIKFFVTWFGKRYVAQNLMAQKRNTPFSRRHVTKEEGDFTNGISYSKQYARTGTKFQTRTNTSGYSFRVGLAIPDL